MENNNNYLVGNLLDPASNIVFSWLHLTDIIHTLHSSCISSVSRIPTGVHGCLFSSCKQTKNVGKSIWSPLSGLIVFDDDKIPHQFVDQYPTCCERSKQGGYTQLSIGNEIESSGVALKEPCLLCLLENDLLNGSDSGSHYFDDEPYIACLKCN